MTGLLFQMGLPQVSTIAPSVDRLYSFLFVISLISFVGTIGALIYFIVRYRRSINHPDKTPYIEGHPMLETAVMVGFFIITMIFFYWGWVDYKKIRKSPPNALEVNVMGRQWAWEFEYTNGRKMLNEVVVPKGQNVKFIMGSSDVLHSFFIPEFRVKQDVVPGTYEYLWFNATQTGEFQVYCAEYCGTSHSGMLAKLKVVEPEQYRKWQKMWEWEKQLGLSPTSEATAAEKGTAPSPTGLSSAATAPAGTKPAETTAMASPVERGQKLFKEKGCNACHTVTGEKLVGPSLKGIFGHEIELEGGQKVLVDENYIRETIVDPNRKIVKGYQPLMPTFKGTLSDDEINSLVAYIKSLGT